MGSAPIADIDDLLANLEGLASAAEEQLDDASSAAFLRTLIRRTAAIHDHLFPETPVAPADPVPITVGDSEELWQAGNSMVEAAEQAGLHFTLTDYLRNASRRLENIHRGQGDHRMAPRRPEEGNAQLEVGDTSHNVRVVEASTLGIGVAVQEPIAADRVVRLIVPEAFGATTYECLTTHARPLDDGYHLGLEIFAVRI